MTPKDPRVPSWNIQQDPPTNQSVVCTTKIKGNVASSNHYPLKASEPSSDHIVQAHLDFYQGIRILENQKLQLHLKHDVTPIQEPVPQMPLHTRKNVDKELKGLLDLDIIKKVSEPTSFLDLSWQSPRQIRPFNYTQISDEHIQLLFVKVMPSLEWTISYRTFKILATFQI